MRKTIPICLGALGVLFAWVVWLSLRWRIDLDSPIMLYLGYLVDQRHCVPYRDFFDMNTPATYALNAFIGHCTGYGDLGFRIADLSILFAMLVTTWFWMRRLGTEVAWCAVLVFGLLYLRMGAANSMQRDYILILPISIGMLIAVSRGKYSVKALLVGLSFGLAAAIKPNAAIGLPVALAYLYLEAKESTIEKSKSRPGLWLLLSACVAGFAVPCLGSLYYLIKVGGLSGFLDMTMHYWPLYRGLAVNSHGMSGPIASAYFRAQGTVSFGPFAVWAVVAAVGVITAMTHSEFGRPQRRLVLLIVGSAIAYAIYPLLAGEFWDYHWLPFTYFVVIAGSLCLVRQPVKRELSDKLIPALVLIIAILITIRPPNLCVHQAQGLGVDTPRSQRVNAIAKYLKAHMNPTDTVQPLDWTGGAIHAMLKARAKVATRFIYDFHFYHDASTPYIKKLRREFVSELANAKPRYIVEIVGPWKPWVSGPNTTRSFPELRNLMRADYSAVDTSNSFIIYERHTSAAKPVSKTLARRACIPVDL